MTTIVTLLGLVIGILVFINLIHTKSQLAGMDLTLDEGIFKKQNHKNPKFKSNRSNQKISRRMCPVCRTPLSMDQYLMCAMDVDRQDGSKRQVHIYGCPHCFLSDGVNKNLNTEKISELHV